ncbi:MAG: hypothetical protein ACE5J9_09345 [Methanosarcinales archaeon]
MSTISLPKDLLEKWHNEDEEARRIRRDSADWEFIRRQQLKVRAALEYLVELGDLYVASKIAGLSLDELDELRMKAKIPKVV